MVVLLKMQCQAVSNLTINNGVGVTVTNAAQIAISGIY
jgi:hypothetical protein